MTPRDAGGEPETLPGSVLDDAELVVDEGDDFGSIDRLLAETDQGWDIDSQLVTLKEAASQSSIIDTTEERPPPRRPLPSTALHIPTPFELAPTLIPATTRMQAPPPSDPVPGMAKPAGKAASKAPPPLPRKGPPPLPPPSVAPGLRASEASPVRLPADMSQPGALIDLLNARVATLETGQDTVGLGRAHMELAIAAEAILGDDARATMHAEAALRIDPTCAAAHAMLRRKKHARSALAAMLGHLESELSTATTEAHKVELLAEKARLLEAVGDKGAEVRATWEQALAHAPHHPAALKGLEAQLVTHALATEASGDWQALATHLGRMADAMGSEKRLSAWLHVERAQILERRVGRLDAARGAFERALELDPSVGPVRDALVRHIASHADWRSLATMLEQEAGIEASVTRAARLELDAAAICMTRLGDRARACELLERAAAHAPTVPSVDRRVLDELVRLHEADNRWGDAARARRARLRFVIDPGAIAYELRALSAAAEKDGDLDTAIADMQRALAVDASDPTQVETLDRLLAATGKHDQRIATWIQEAARTDDGAHRSKALIRAAQICDQLGRAGDAIRHLRSAWVAAPGDPETLDSLARLLAPVFSEVVDAGARSLVELYAQAAEHATDVGRKIAYLEKVALLWEELLGDASRAARAYEHVLELDPDRRGALLGLERTAARLGDQRALARALLDEARLATDGGTRLSLQTRAATALTKHDPSRAMQLLREVLRADPAHPGARALETQLEQEAGRWDLAAQSLKARLDAAKVSSEKVVLWLSLSRLQHEHLHEPLKALQSLEQAHAVDPSHPVPAEEIARILEDHGDAKVLRDAVERLANHAGTPDERARHLTRAAEIDELRLGDDASALRTYQRALAETPDDDLVAERLARVVARRCQQGVGGGLGELANLLAKRIERAASPSAAQAMSFELAALLVDMGQEQARATSLLESAIAEQGDHVQALRALESLRRRAGDSAPLARVLAKQGEELHDSRARLGALWNLAALEEWKLPVGDPAQTYRQILELDPTDPGALEATLRRELGNARRGDPRSRQTVIGVLRALVPFSSDDGTRLALQLRLALLLETAADESPDVHTVEELSREALSRYSDALRLDELSVTASTSLARLAAKLNDAEAALAAATSLADLAREPRVRARYLVDAAELLLGAESDRLGRTVDRRARAATMLERALQADPDSIAAAGRLATVLLQDGHGERLVSAFREALGTAKSPDALVMLGSEIARVARDELSDLTVAIDAMRRVRAAAPQHVPSLLTLAELCIAQRAWPEAVDALEAVVSTSREVSPKLTALFALASIYEKVLSRPDDVDRVLRAALFIEPTNARALRALVRRVAADSVENDEAAHRARREVVADLLGRLAQVEKDPEQKTGILQELAEVRQRLGDAAAAERALVEAVATSPSNARAFARLAGLFRRPPGRDATAYARALAAVIGLGQQLGHVDARWFATLGTLEVHDLSRVKDGVAHMQRAVQLDATLHETRFELASAYSKMGAHEEAARALLAMLVPTAAPLLAIADPAAGLALLEQTFSLDRRTDEAVVVSELRALAGELDDGRRSWLQARRLPPLDPQHGVLDRPALVTHVLPPEGRHILLEVAAAIAGVEAKMLRGDLSELGIASRDRLTTRSGHPTRLLLDRVAKMLGVGEVELAIAPSVPRVRVLAQDVPWIIVPRSFVEQREAAQLAGLARAAARIAYGVPWLEELQPEHIEALLVAAARHVVPGYGADEVDVITSKLVTQHEATIGRLLTRRQKKVLEELAPHIAAPQSRPLPADVFVAALGRAELRAAFLLTGDLLVVLDEMKDIDPALRRATATPGPQTLAAVFEHPLAGDVARFALGSEATALRRRLGTTWT